MPSSMKLAPIKALKILAFVDIGWFLTLGCLVSVALIRRISYLLEKILIPAHDHMIATFYPNRGRETTKWAFPGGGFWKNSRHRAYGIDSNSPPNLDDYGENRGHAGKGPCGYGTGSSIRSFLGLVHLVVVVATLFWATMVY